MNISQVARKVDVKRFNTECTEKGAQRPQRKMRISALSIALTLIYLPASAHGQTPAPATPSSKPSTGAPATALQKSVEAYLRNLYALGPNVRLTVSVPQDSEVPGLLETTVDVKDGENSQSAKFYLSKDGKYLVRGEISDLSKDPLAETRALIQMKEAPSLGDPKAPVTLVEFSDFECPVCRSLHDVLRGMLPNYPQVRVVFKDFPLESLHLGRGRRRWRGAALTSKTRRRSGRSMTRSMTSRRLSRPRTHGRRWRILPLRLV
jgi:protein-disulfide isomerase